MSDTVRCPGCGLETAAGEFCEHCNYPLRERASAPPAAGPAPPAGAPGQGAAPPPEPAPPSSGATPPLRPTRPIRPRRPAPTSPLQTQLWLMSGLFAVLLLLWYGAHGFWKVNQPTVTGAQPEQQKTADAARAILEKDSTNVEAQISLANVLYDTGNWSDAIVHYRAASRLDPRRSTTLVDMGVCYYNLSAFAVAESLFQASLALDPHQAVALFNLGILNESRQQWEPALQFYHRAMQSDPPEEMRQPLMQHMQAVMQKLGKTAPPMAPPGN